MLRKLGSESQAGRDGVGDGMAADRATTTLLLLRPLDGEQESLDAAARLRESGCVRIVGVDEAARLRG